jgi:small subunit ribosomal protein S16
MPVKIRLQRHGKKGKPFFWVVAADSRAKRDGKFLEKIGTYNPNTNPATIDLNIDAAAQWLFHGAQPTDTARAILSYKGAMLKHHLNGGVRKGAITQEQADAKFDAWVSEKEAKVQSKRDGLSQAEADVKAKAFKAEQEINQKRAKAAEAALKVEEAVEEEVVAEETSVAVEETTEAPAEEVNETTATEEKTEE